MSKKQTAFATILLMITLCVSNLLAAQYFPDDLNMPARVNQSFVKAESKFLESMKEPPLWPRAKDPNAISYRLSCTGFKQKPVIFRLDRITNTKWVLTTKQADYWPANNVSKLNRKQSLTKEEVVQFQKLFTELQFWQLPSVGAFEVEEEIMDGTTWILEAVEKGRYHLVRRRAPRDSDRFWFSDPRHAAELQKIKEKEGYPDIDRDTSAEVNNKLVAVGEFLVKLSGLKVEVH
ncbi:exported hypothetical protein [Syntrophobacter sp. SbD1]|nr:exported hypothetical protein [Syntrophobacter sp. SbD1]